MLKKGLNTGDCWVEKLKTSSREEINEIQLEKIKKQVSYNYKNSIFYQRKLDAAGIEPGDIKTWDDFHHVPFMDKDEHRAAQEESTAQFGHPFGMLACAPLDKIVRLSFTSGTSGTPTIYTLTKNDIKVTNMLNARKYRFIGLQPGHIVINGFGLSMFAGGVPVVDALWDYGVCVVPVGAEARSRRLLESAQLIKADALFCTPSFAEYLAEQAGDVLGKPIRELGLNFLVCGGEPGAGVPEFKKKMEEAYGTRLFDINGAVQPLHCISCDSDRYYGMHFLSEDYCYLELIDPETGRPLELTEGVTGEQVFTWLDWEGTPFLRYRLGDILQIHTDPCHCGGPGMRIKVIGRTDDMLIVKGVNVYPSAIKDLLVKYMPRVTGAFRIVLDRPGPKVEPPLKIKIERGEGLEGSALDKLKHEIEEDMSSVNRVRPEIFFVSPYSLERKENKTQYIELDPNN